MSGKKAFQVRASVSYSDPVRLRETMSLAPKGCEVSHFSFYWLGNPAACVVLVSESTVFDHVDDDAWTPPSCAAYGMNISRVCC